MNKRVWIVVLLFIFSVSNLTGCANLKKKFTRKKKKKDELPMYYNVKEYDIKPSLELYTKHYIYWKNWNRDLLDNLGKNSKKDRENVNQVIGELVAMRAMLNPPKYDDMQKHLDRMHEIKSFLLQGRKDATTMARIRRMVEIEQRNVKLEFSYNKIGSFIASDFEWREQPNPLPKADKEIEVIDKDPDAEFLFEEDTVGAGSKPALKEEKPVNEVAVGEPQRLDPDVKSIVFNK